MPGVFEAARLRYVLTADTTNLIAGLAMADRAVSRHAGMATNIMAAATAATAIGIGMLAKTTLQAGMDYEDAMNVFQATTRATGDQMGKVSEKAKELGADLTLPATSAGDAGQVMTELAKAGFNVQQSMDAAKGSLQLAAAAQMDNAEAAQINATAINAFRLPAKDAGKIADYLANTANSSSVSLHDVAMSFRMASGVFSSFQGPVVSADGAIKDLSASIGILGNAGMRGSDAGTSMKQMLLQLTGPSMHAKDAMRAVYQASLLVGKEQQKVAITLGSGKKATQSYITVQEALTMAMSGSNKQRKAANAALAQLTGTLDKGGDVAYDEAGAMRSLGDIVNLTSKGVKGMTDEQRNYALSTIYGADATRSMLALMQAGPDGFAKMRTSIERQGAAAEIAAAKNAGLRGAFDKLRSQIETVGIEIYEKIGPGLGEGVRDLAAAVPVAADRVSAFFKDLKANESVQGTWKKVKDTFSDLSQFTTGTFIPALQNLWTAAGPTMKTAVDIGVQAFRTVVDILQFLAPAIRGVTGFLADHGTAVRNVAIVVGTLYAAWWTARTAIMAYRAAMVAIQVVQGIYTAGTLGASIIQSTFTKSLIVATGRIAAWIAGLGGSTAATGAASTGTLALTGATTAFAGANSAAAPTVVWLTDVTVVQTAAMGRLAGSIAAVTAALGMASTSQVRTTATTAVQTLAVNAAAGANTRLAITSGAATAAASGQLLMAQKVGGAYVITTLATNAQSGAFARLAAAMGLTRVAAIATTAAQWALNVALTANPIGIVVVAIGALVGGLIYAYKHSETFRNIVNGAFSAVATAAKAVWEVVKHPMDSLGTAFDWVKDKAAAVGDWFRDHWKEALFVALTGPMGLAALYIRSKWNEMKNFFTGAVSNIGNGIAALPGLIKTHIERMVHLAAETLARLPEIIGTAIGWALTAAITVLLSGPALIINAVRKWGPAALEGLKDLGTMLYNKANEVALAFVTGVVTTGGQVINWFQELPGKIEAFVNSIPGRMLAFGLAAGNAIYNGILKAADALWGFFTSFGPKVLGFIVNLPQNLAEFGIRAVLGLKDGAVRGFLEVAKFFVGLPDRIKGYLSGAKDWLVGLGQDLISGLIRGIVNFGPRLTNAIKSTVTDHVPDYIKKAMGIHSPARVMIPLGRNITEGLAVGVEDRFSMLRSTMQDARDIAALRMDTTGAVVDQIAPTLSNGTVAGTASAGTVSLGDTNITIQVASASPEDRKAMLAEVQALLAERDEKLLQALGAR